MWGYWLFGVLALGATGRITRLITSDTITAPLRARAARVIREETRDAFATFITCPWCVSVWVAPPVIALGWWPARADDRVGNRPPDIRTGQRLAHRDNRGGHPWP